MASGGEDRTIRWWDLGPRKEAGRAEAGFSVEQVAFSPDGRLLAVCGSDIKVHMWNCETRRKERELPLHQANVLSVAWSADGMHAASGSYDGTIRLWHMPASTELAVLGRGAPVRCVAFDPNNTLLASASEDGLVRLWDVDCHEVLMTLRGHTANVRALTFSPKSGMLASGDEASVAKLWEVSTSPGRENALLHVGIVNGLAFSPDGQRLASIDATIDTLLICGTPARSNH